MQTGEDQLPPPPPPLIRENARLTVDEPEEEDPPSSDEEDEDPLPFVLLIAVLATIHVKNIIPKPATRPWSFLTRRR